MDKLLPTDSYELAMFAGAILATFLISRLMLWIVAVVSRTKIRNLSSPRLVAAHVLALAVIVVGAGFGFADGGPFRTDVQAGYLIPWLGWLFFDGIRLDRSKQRSAN